MKSKKIVQIIVSILSIVLVVLTLVGTVYHFVRGINLSLFEDDIKTAQNRIRSAYQFLMMLSSGICLIGSLIFFFKTKNWFVPKAIQKALGIADLENERAEVLE